MIPKLKAKDLVRDMEFEIPYVYDPTEPQGYDVAKKCALIAVDEIIKHIEVSYHNKDIIKGSKLYWQEVKNEIEKL